MPMDCVSGTTNESLNSILWGYFLASCNTASQRLDSHRRQMTSGPHHPCSSFLALSGGIAVPRLGICLSLEHESPLMLPGAEDEVIRQYTFSKFDLATIRQKRVEANRLGFAAQLHWIGRQRCVDPTCWTASAVREETIPSICPNCSLTPTSSHLALLATARPCLRPWNPAIGLGARFHSDF